MRFDFTKYQVRSTHERYICVHGSFILFQFLWLARYILSWFSFTEYFIKTINDKNKKTNHHTIFCTFSSDLCDTIKVVSIANLVQTSYHTYKLMQSCHLQWQVNLYECPYTGPCFSHASTVPSGSDLTTRCPEPFAMMLWTAARETSVQNTRPSSGS